MTIARRGKFPYSDDEADRTIRRLYETESAFWHDNDFLYTLVVLYPTDAPSGNFGGEGKTRSFCMHLSKQDKLSFPVLHMLSHELFHGWNPGRLKWDGRSDYWFTEGFTDYYATLMLRQAGLCSDDEVIKYINNVLRGYYLSPARNFSYERLLKERDVSFDIDRMIYRRGMLQALNWNRLIRDDTKGTYSLDDAMRNLLHTAISQKQFRLSNDTIVAALKPYLKQDPGLDIERYMEEGATISPLENSLGDLTTLEMAECPIFELGLDPSSFKTKRIAGVIPTSNAYRAGLRDGQVMISANLTGDTRVPVEITIREGDDLRIVTYYPQGSRVLVPQFKMKSDSQ